LVLPGMRRQRWGKIVNLSSMGGRLTLPGGAFYHATKYAVEALSDALRFEVRAFGIDVIVVEPGPIRTRFGDTAIASIGSAARDAALEAGRRSLDGGRAIDEHQVHAERLAYAATEVAAAEALAAYARDRHAAGAGDTTTDAMAAAFAAEVADRLAARIAGHREDFGVGTTPLENAAVQAAIRTAQHEARFREIGREVIRTRGANNAWL